MSAELPDVTVLILTYERETELKKTMAALRQHLKYPADKLHFLIVDDASPSGVAKYRKLPDFKGVKWRVNDKNAGWGVTVNRGLMAVETDLVFFLEDDYVLKRDLDLAAGAALMTVKPHVGMLRYRGTAGDHVVLHQFEAEIGELVPDFREGMAVHGKIAYLQLDGGSPTSYLYTNGPHLKRRYFHGFYGLYAEGLKLGRTEEEFAVRVKNRMRNEPDLAPGIAILPEWVPMWFDHIGQSYQHSEVDTGAALP